VNGWNSVTFSPTTTTLTLNSGTAVNITHGHSVPVQVTVAPQSGTGTPSGDVVLLSDLTLPPNDQSLALLTPLTAGSVSSNISSLPGGTYNVHAQYGGDATYAPSPSNSVPVTVSPEGSTTTDSAFLVDAFGNVNSFTSTPYGQFIYLRADVKGQSGQGIPTGTVYFVDNSTTVANSSLNSQGTASTPQMITTLRAGQHSVVANYTGDNSFNASSSSPTTFTITKGSTSTTVQASPASVAQGSGTTLTANIATSSQGGPPSGSVTFLSNGTPLGTAPVQGVYWSVNPQTGGIVPDSGTATFFTSSLPTGSNSITAQYAGDTDYVGSNSGSTTVNVLPDFSLPASLNGVTVARGKTGTTALTITGQTGYNSTLNFSSASCLGLPFESTCSFTPASVTGSGQTTITVTTTAPTAMLLTPHSLEFWASTGGFSVVGIFLLGASPRRRRWARLFSLLVFAGLVAGIGCGGGSSSSGPPPNPGTPLGTYTVIVNASTGPLSHSTSFVLTVQQ
jgi:trimeric autotransporter adhesin